MPACDRHTDHCSCDLWCYEWFILGSSPSESTSLGQSDIVRHEMKKYLQIPTYKDKSSCLKKSRRGISKKKIVTTSLKISSSGKTLFWDPLLLFPGLWLCDQNWSNCLFWWGSVELLAQWVQLTKAMKSKYIFLPSRTFHTSVTTLLPSKSPWSFHHPV